MEKMARHTLKRRLTLLLATTSVMSSVFIAPALAISSISNSFTANDYTPVGGQTIYFKATSNYGWYALQNPYSSNFVTEVNNYHFARPTTYESAGLSNPNNWAYVNPGWFTSPAYRYVSQWMWINPTQTYYAKFYATAKSGATIGSKRSSRHGQATEANWDISYGPPAWITTTKN